MTPDQYRLVKEIFADVCDMTPRQRGVALEARCAGDSLLRAGVERMLAHDVDPAHLEEGAPLVAWMGDELEAQRHVSPSGAYQVRRVVGEGGFGVVYEAEQLEPVRRRVAIKVLKLGMDTREVIHRFDAERQTLALMEHPGIARVLDAGATATGRPYFVMEFVEGELVTEYCLRHELGLSQRLDLFLEICSAVQHAHQKGVIHRDLKPSNIVVSHQSGHATPIVIDFGISKAVDDRTVGRTRLTRIGQFVGTPQYMAPEQAAAGQDIDTRCDIYALGAILYEMLAGCPPLDRERLRAASSAELHRILQEEAPVRPSLRALQEGARAGSVAPRALRGDLDWIVMRCLEKDRSRRYATVGDLAADVRRTMHHEPVTAGPPATSYRLRKFGRRHRIGLAVATTLALAMTIGAAGITIGLIRAREASASALRQAYRASVNAAAVSMDQRRSVAAQRYLTEAPAEHRGWEWRHLSARLDDSVAQFTAPGTPHHVYAGPDGRSAIVLGTELDEGRITTRGFIARISLGPSAVLERVETGERVPRGAQITPAGHLVVREVGSSNARVVVRDTERFQPSHTLLVPNGLWLGDANQQYIAHHETANRMLVTELASGEVRGRLQLPLDIQQLRVSARGLVSVLMDNGAVALVHAETCKLRTHIPHDMVDATMTAFSPDGSQLAIGGRSGAIDLWDVRAPAPLRRATLRGHSGIVQAIAYSADGSLIATGGADGSVRIWNAVDGAPGTVLLGHARDVDSIAFLPDGRRLITCGDEPDSIRLWDIGIDAMRILRGHAGFVYPVIMTPDQSMIISGGWDGWVGRRGALRFWDRATGEPIASAGAPGDIVEALACSPDGSLLAVGLGGASNRIVLRDLESGAVVQEIPLDIEPVALAFDPAGKRLACGARFTGALRVVDVASGQVMHAAPTRGGLTCIAWSGATGRLAVTSRAISEQPVIELLDGDTFETLQTWPAHDGGINSIEFSADGRLLVTGSADKTARVWDSATGRQRAELVGHGLGVLCATFSPDATRVATGGRDGDLRIWDARWGDQLANLGGHTDYIFSLAWTADGTTLVSGSGDRSLRIWGVADAASCVDRAAQRAAASARMAPLVPSRLRTESARAVARALRTDPDLSPVERRVGLQAVLAAGVQAPPP